MKIIGHRGAAGLAPENTLAAIEAGIQNGADEIEIDVRITPDGVPVLAHDSIVEAKPVPLATAIKTADRKRPLIIDIKPGEAVAPIADVLQTYLESGWKTKDFSIASFDLKVLLQAKKFLPDVQLIVLDKWSGVRATHRARLLGTKKIGMNHRWLWSGFIARLHSGGYELACYTLNNPKRAKRWEKHGLYGVVTDYPDRFKP